jgi:Fe-S cluster biosynthesis and repair protein YggX
VPSCLGCPSCDTGAVTRRPWPIWKHRTIGEMVTREGWRRWRARRPVIVEVHRVAAMVGFDDRQLMDDRAMLRALSDDLRNRF